MKKIISLIVGIAMLAALFIGSGDLLTRNLERRVGAFIEVVTPDTRAQINTVLDALRNDREKSRRMLPDGSYVRELGGEGSSSQEALYRYFSACKVSPDAPPEKAPVTVLPVSLELAVPGQSRI